MSQILFVAAREIFDSRGVPTVEVDIGIKIGQFRASVPSGANGSTSSSAYEVRDLRDGDKKRVMGKGVMKAIQNIKDVLGPRLLGMDVTDQVAIDKVMVEELDGTKNDWGWCKTNLGANAILAVSMAVCRAGAAAKGKRLYQHVATLAGKDEDEYVLPMPAFKMFGGGLHSASRMSCQEMMIVPVGATSFREAMQVGVEVYHTLKGVMKKQYGQDGCNVGDEGAFNIRGENDEALDVLMTAVNDSGHADKVKIAMDMAASEFYSKRPGNPGIYDLDFKNPNGSPANMKKDIEKLIVCYQSWMAKFPIISIEDPFEQDDFEGFARFQAEVGSKLQIVGDDLLATNTKRIQLAIEKKMCNTLLLKLNQIGTISEAIEAAKLAHGAGWGVQVSHRSGETEDSFIADLAVGLRAGQIKTGAPCRSERLAKYNQLLRIEEEIMEAGMGKFAGEAFRRP